MQNRKTKLVLFSSYRQRIFCPSFFIRCVGDCWFSWAPKHAKTLQNLLFFRTKFRRRDCKINSVYCVLRIWVCVRFSSFIRHFWIFVSAILVVCCFFACCLFLPLSSISLYCFQIFCRSENIFRFRCCCCARVYFWLCFEAVWSTQGNVFRFWLHFYSKCV